MHREWETGVTIDKKKKKKKKKNTVSYPTKVEPLVVSVHYNLAIARVKLVHFLANLATSENMVYGGMGGGRDVRQQIRHQLTRSK